MATHAESRSIEWLYLLVKPNGSKLWHMAYRFNGRQKKLSFGVYGPDGQGKVSLAAARQKRDAKTLIAQGIDPGVAKKEEKQEKAAARLFSSWADEWLGAEEKVCSERTMKGKRRFVRYLKNQFGSSTIRDITVEKVVGYLKTVQDEGKLETRDRVRAAGEDICKFADLKRTGYNPFRDLGDFLMENISEPRPAIVEPIKAVAQLFQNIAAPLNDARFGDLVGYGLRFLSLTAVRPGEVNNAEWVEIDWDKARWIIPGEKMKMDKDHVVPLARQALDILKAVRQLTGNRRYIFSCTDDQPLSDNTLNKRLRVIGYDTSMEHCAHGFRGSMQWSMSRKSFRSMVRSVGDAGCQPKNLFRKYRRSEMTGSLGAQVNVSQFASQFVSRILVDRAVGIIGRES